ncbi:aminoacyl-tRNA hydrolase [Ligilactobacillus cholophilus]|uniref:aminoacyl-tRNA hydrolase n=1 Tax=Ligilactobacillus cholophilus TaxID=3050131 RepID=UPI0025AF421F|nr:aminoacyl-tRNA hydrolase [Ligilactobacillus cholophilus]
MKMIVGLGNIGARYDKTRHNTGFMIVDELAERNHIDFDKEKCNAMIGLGMIENEKVILVKPKTFMNESGRAVKPLMDYYKIDKDDILIIQDDLDMEVGRIRLRQKGSAGGHNGIKSIIQHVGTQEFKRLKVGIGRPKIMTVVDWVLGKFKPSEQLQFNNAKDQAVDAIEYWIASGDFMKTMNKFN